MNFCPDDSRCASRTRLLHRVALAVCALVMAGAAAGSPPATLARGEPKIGEPPGEKDCAACYVWRIDGGADRIHMRSERRKRAAAALEAQTSYCSAELGTGYFPEEEEHLAAYLNKRHYRFE
jgi:hypothetical protein